MRSAHSALTASLAHDLARAIAQQRVLEHQQVGVEDVGVRRPHLPREAVLDPPQLLAGRPDRLLEPPHLGVEPLRGHGQAEDGSGVALHDERASHRDAG